MPAIQTSYTQFMPAATPGQVPDMTQSDIISRTLQSASAGLGVPVFQGSIDRGVKVAADVVPSAALFLGVTVYDRAILDGNAYTQGESLRVLKKGPIIVTAAVAVAAADPVYVTSTGAFSNVNSAGAFQIPNARWDTSAGAGKTGAIFIK